MRVLREAEDWGQCLEYTVNAGHGIMFLRHTLPVFRAHYSLFSVG
jgi:hypothetical protein